MKLRVLHEVQSRQPAVGIVRHMEYEQSATDKNQIKLASRMYCPRCTDSPVVVPQGKTEWIVFKKASSPSLRAR